MRRSKKTSKLRVTSLCVGNSLVTDEFPAQWASNAENVSIWWRHRESYKLSNRQSYENGDTIYQNITTWKYTTVTWIKCIGVAKEQFYLSLISIN